ncbi:hypothetical protein, partial [Collinsella aerofaciens]
MFVKGPVGTSVILVSSGNPEIERAISTIAGSSDSLRSVAHYSLKWATDKFRWRAFGALPTIRA